MAWVLRRTDHCGCYVARLGVHRSYTHNVIGAQRFPTREAAEAEACLGDEVPVNLHDL